jgi:hypothetical protein
VVVLGPPGAARAAVESSLRETAERQKASLDIEPSDTLLAGPRTVSEPGAVIVAEPTERLVREAFRGALDGLIDPYPPPLRVVVVQDGRAMAAQLADPSENGEEGLARPDQRGSATPANP